MSQDNTPKEETYLPPEVPQVDVDTTKGEVDHFDWNQNKYVYKRDIPVEPDYGKLLKKEPEPYPDLFVGTTGGFPMEDALPKEGDQWVTPTKEHLVIKDGKRYRVWAKANGEIELIRVR